MLVEILFLALISAKHDECREAVRANKNTSRWYAENAAGYIDKTSRLSPNVQRFRDQFLGLLPAQSILADIGAAQGRESLHFAQQGHYVHMMEPVQELLNRAPEHSNILKLNIFAQQIDIENLYDGVWSMAVLHHVHEDELADVIHRIYRSMKEGAIFSSSWVQGIGTPDRGEYDENQERYFNRASPERIRQLMIGAGFEVIEDVTYLAGNDYFSKDQAPEGIHWFNISVRK